jgi:monoamine oxidase
MLKSVRNLPLRLLQDIFRRQQNSDFSEKRRVFLQKTIAAAALTSVAPAAMAQTLRSAATPRIAIIGAGIGGLTTAWYLNKKGIPSTVYEASHRSGGRTLSMRGMFGEAIAVDLGGEFIDTWHEDMIVLAKEMEIPLTDIRLSGAPDTPTRFYGGERRSDAVLEAAMRPFAAAFQEDIKRIPEDISYRNIAPCQYLDEMSIEDYLKQKGVSGWLYDYLWNAFTLEYGMDANEQSALNMLTVLHVPGDNDDEVIGGDGSEVLRMQGGTQTLSERLAARLPANTVRYNQPLTALEVSTNGSEVQLFFEEGTPVTADYVVLALPFTKLRELHLTAPLSDRKRNAINTLGYGNSSKLVLGFKSRRWNELGFSGDVSSDLPFAQSGWDGSATQPGPAGAWTLFGGGKYSRMLMEGDLAAHTKTCLKSLNQLFPKVKKRYNGTSQFWPWESYQWSKAAYSCWKTGQWTAFAGAEGEREGRLLFAGEHCSVEFQGFMNGAAESGRKAAEDIIRLLAP